MAENQTGLEWLICREPVHIGGADSSSRGNNNPVYRLPDRTPVIPGSSIRGALREHAQTDDAYNQYVRDWFGSENQDSTRQESENQTVTDPTPQPSAGENQDSTRQESNKMSPGCVALSWCWPVWWPVHVLGYGNWWVSCPAWLNRFQQFSHQSSLPFGRDNVYITEPSLANAKNLYLRWLKLKNIHQHEPESLPLPINGENLPDKNRLIVVPDDTINLIVDMGLVRQPRVSLNDTPDEKGSLVKNLFAVEGLPPGALFMMAWTTRGNKELNLEQWQKFLRQEHYLGGLWSVGYGRISIQFAGKLPATSAEETAANTESSETLTAPTEEIPENSQSKSEG
ncbi:MULTISPECIES: RAMP superfamily CRISPR-associated protein [Kamptonema]|uniref:RAMP superfamily CRISPR-associated protein n=1 Tax=Kamptonema TaxID=1501433 RepID=UPI0001DACF19|nr:MULTISPECIES: RAMP superfamily CRISPR-associated protein [Kamptonema]CBN56405.1 conserved hypothetical protein [Kamptonema sp. PCC 6506]